MKRPRKKAVGFSAVIVVVAAAAATAVVATVNGDDGHSNRAAEQTTVVADDLLPGATASDWVTYGDYVVTMTIDSEQAKPLSPDVTRTGEGLVGRIVKASISDVLWARPGLPSEPPKVLSIDTQGWQYKDGDRIPLSAPGHPRLTVGASYLMPITNYSGNLSSPDWGELSSNTVLSITGGQVTRVAQNNGTIPAGTIAAELVAKPATNLKQRLNATPPEPGANLSLPPVQRLEAAPR